MLYTIDECSDFEIKVHFFRFILCFRIHYAGAMRDGYFDVGMGRSTRPGVTTHPFHHGKRSPAPDTSRRTMSATCAYSARAGWVAGGRSVGRTAAGDDPEYELQAVVDVPRLGLAIARADTADPDGLFGEAAAVADVVRCQRGSAVSDGSAAIERVGRQEDKPDRQHDTDVLDQSEQLGAGLLETAGALATALVEGEHAVDEADLFVAVVAVG